MSLAAYVSGIGVLGPGLPDWAATAAVLSGRSAYTPARTVLPVPTLLPAAELRRCGRVVKLAIGVALEATTRAATDPAQLASVFASSGADGHNCHEVCQALALESREMSPTRFANAVHNAAAGYWSIATQATLASNVICAFDSSFCAGLLEALAQVAVDDQSVLLVAYDTEYPEPLHAKRPLPDAFGAALVLTPRRTQASLARIDVALDANSNLDDAAASAHASDAMADAQLEALRRAIPAARCLPMLECLARGEPARTVLDYLDGSRVTVRVDPCA